MPEADGVPLLFGDGSLLEEILVTGQVPLGILQNGGRALHGLLRALDLLCPGPGPDFVQLGGQRAHARLGPGDFRGEGSFENRMHRFRLFAASERSFVVGLGLFEAGVELRRIRLGQKLILRDGLPLLRMNLENASAGLERQSGLDGFDRSGVGKLSRPGLLLAAIYIEGRSDHKRQHDDEGNAFLQGLPPSINFVISYHLSFEKKIILTNRRGWVRRLSDPARWCRWRSLGERFDPRTMALDHFRRTC